MAYDHPSGSGGGLCREGPSARQETTLIAKLANLPARIGVGLVRCYQIVLGPIFGGRCRFEPSCSEYAVLAFKRYGLVKGCGLTAWRICRCQPLCKGGIDYP